MGERGWLWDCEGYVSIESASSHFSYLGLSFPLCKVGIRATREQGC